jgi:hypothetical protein
MLRLNGWIRFSFLKRLDLELQKSVYADDMQNLPLSNYQIIHELLAKIEHHLVMLSTYFSAESSVQLAENLV